MGLKEVMDTLKFEADKRFDNFEIEEIGELCKIQDDAYLEKSTWLGGDEKFTCLCIDLDSSSKHSAKRKASTMAKLYEYFTQNIVDVLSLTAIKADYIDIKGDGAFGIYGGENCIEKAFIAGITFKTFFEKNIKEKFKSEFSLDLICKLGIAKD
jgi:hypothetical protein